MEHKAKLKLEREVKTFWDLNHASFVMLDLSKTVQEGSYYSLMASILFSAFTFEAYLNHIGSIKIKHWDEIERIKVLNKYSVLCKEFEIEVNKGARPFQTIKNLFEFRNSIAHGKSEILMTEKEVPIETDIRDEVLLTKWEEFCTRDNAEKCYVDIMTAIEELNKKCGEGDYPFTSGITIGSMSY